MATPERRTLDTEPVPIEPALRQPVIVGESAAMRDLVRMAERIAEVDCTVLLLGESGVGKDLIARFIHQAGRRRHGPFVRVNCGAIPDTLLEAELFGYEYGAFTGARREGHPGKFELAGGGTILLDEIGDLPVHLQVKLLRVLQDGEVAPLGAKVPRPVNARVIAATNRNLKEMVLSGAFREDLYFRLNVVSLYVPALRERRDDILPLTLHFKRACERKYRIKRQCSRDVVDLFQEYEWPGNIRELQNTVERIYVLAEPGEVMTPAIVARHFLDTGWRRRQRPVCVTEIAPLKEVLQEAEAQLLRLALKRLGNVRQIASALGVDASTASRKLRRLALRS